MKRLIIILSFIAVGCKPTATETINNVPFFNVATFAKKLLKTHSSLSNTVTKTSYVNNLIEKTEISKTDSVFWKTELTPLISVDLNKPFLKDAYTIEVDLPEKSSNLLKTIYTALPQSNTSIKKMEIKYLNTPKEIRAVFVVIENNNSVYTSKQEIKLWVNKYGNQLQVDSLIFKGYNNTILLDSMAYESKVVVNQ